MERRRIIIANEPHVETIESAGSSISFSTDVPSNMKSLIVNFTPYQDGSGVPSSSNVRNIHGYTGIDVIVCGKNLLYDDGKIPQKYTVNGLTAVRNDDGSVVVNGTATAQTFFFVGYVSNLATNGDILSGCPSGGGTSTFELQADFDGVAAGITYGEDVPLTMSLGAKNRIYIRIGNGYVADNLVFKPMVRKAGSANSEYAPIGNLYSLDWTDTAGTVYGGYVDLINGKLIDTMIYRVMPTSGDYSGRITAVAKDDNYGSTRFWLWWDGGNRAQKPIVCCNRLQPMPTYNAIPFYDNIDYIGVSDVYKKSTCQTLPTAIVGDSVSTIYAYIKDNPIIYVDYRETPIEYNLAGTNIKTFRNENNFVSNIKNSTVSVTCWTH